MIFSFQNSLKKEKKMAYNKYYQNKKDRRHESEGMSRYEKEKGMKRHGLDSSFMGMIHEDPYQPANLPQQVIHKDYPACDYMDKYELDDTIRGMDENISDSINKLDDYPSDSMY